MISNGCQNYLALEANLDYPELSYVGGDDEIQTQVDSGSTFFFGFDKPTLRKELFSSFDFKGISLISDTSVCSTSINQSGGITVGDLAYLGPRVKIQNFVKIGVRASIHHDSSVGQFSVIGPSVTICGKVSVGDEVFIGAGATILPGLDVGKRSVIGAGAVVTKDVPANSCVVGVPAKLI
jgi:UDP-perosamine 4-acetyltransferase